MYRGPMLAQPASLDDARIAAPTRGHRFKGPRLSTRNPTLQFSYSLAGLLCRLSRMSVFSSAGVSCGRLMPSWLRSVFICFHPWFLPQAEQQRGSLHRPEGAERPDHVGGERFDPPRPADLQLLQKMLQQYDEQDERDLTDLEPQVEAQQRERQLGAWQAGTAQGARKAKAEQRPEDKRGDPRFLDRETGLTAPRAHDLGSEEENAQRNGGIERQRG